MLQTLSSQMTPLHIASLHDHIELAKVLLKAGAKLDAKDSSGKVRIYNIVQSEVRESTVIGLV